VTLTAPALRRAAPSAGVGTAVLLAVAPASASAASERFRCDSLTAEGHEATDFLNGLPGAAARTSEPAGRARQPGEVPAGIRLVALPTTAPVRGGPAQQQHIAQADPDHFRTSTPPESRTSYYFPWSAWVQLLYHQQTKKLLGRPCSVPKTGAVSPVEPPAVRRPSGRALRCRYLEITRERSATTHSLPRQTAVCS
jgi:hypothetical protein